ncbi:MAG: hypothetical protein HZA48_03580 [Planctomycetes bacterium]|nr:hypothetical protein [Planctomycetota bacterium]
MESKNDNDLKGVRGQLLKIKFWPTSTFDTISEGTSEICDYNYTGPFRVKQRIYQENSGNPITLDVTYNNNRWATEYRYTGAKTWQATEIDKKGKPKKYDYVPQTIGFAYDFDKEGNKKYEKFLHQIGKGLPDGALAQSGDLFRYDNVYRLTGVKYGVQNPENWAGNFDNAPYADREIFNMDNVGNRTTVTNGTTTTYQTNNLNQYTAINGTNPTYDLNGNMTNDGYNQITYDYTNHPVRFDNADYIVEMRYDALGRRIEKKAMKKSDGTFDLEGYVLDGARVISDMATDGLPTKQYVWGNGIDELLVTAKGRSREYDFYLQNSLGSVTHIANKKAEVQESYKYKVYGTVTIFDRKGEIANKSKEKNRYMFTGREYEPETKLHYYRSRYYSYTIGKFLQKDKWFLWNENFYSYTRNNPLLYTDPLGMYPLGPSILMPDDFERFSLNPSTILQNLVDAVEKNGKGTFARQEALKLLYTKLSQFGAIPVLGAPLASKHMSHWLSKEGTPIFVPSEKIVSDANAKIEIEKLKLKLESQIKCSSVATSPTPFSRVKSDLVTASGDLFLAMGRFYIEAYGSYTIVKPSEAEVFVHYEVEDDYNWHSGLTVTIAGVEIPDKFAEELELEFKEAMGFKMFSDWTESYLFKCKHATMSSLLSAPVTKRDDALPVR